jgi:hypothetical protein
MPAMAQASIKYKPLNNHLFQQLSCEGCLLGYKNKHRFGILSILVIF